MGLLLVVNFHGTINVPHAARKALVELHIERKFSATVVKDDGQTVGILKLCKDYLAWSPFEAELLAALLKSRAKVSETKRLDEKALKTLGFKKYEDLATKIVKDEMKLSSVEGLRPFFKLAPPRGGFKQSTRRQSQERGVLGANPKLSEIIKRMI
ncbi:MAG: uL30 family ribosomal protein [Thaumarchaeota archaeon]|nr:uL30 family ribosomal protein [Nitrososphaerota archaeon]